MSDVKGVGPGSGSVTGRDSTGSVGADRSPGRYPVIDERMTALLERKRTTRRRRQRGWLMRRRLLVADMVGYVIAVAAIELLYGSRGAPDAVPLAGELALFAIGLPAFLVGAKLFGLYDRDEERAEHSTSSDLLRVFLLFTVGVFLMTRLPALAGSADPELTKFTAFWALGIVVVTAAREAARAVGRHGADYLQNTIIVGAGDVGQLVARKVLHHPEYGLNLVGFVDDHPLERRSFLGHLPVQRGLEELPRLVADNDVDRVIFAFSVNPHDELLPLIRHLRDAGVQVDLVPRLFEVIGPKVDIHSVEGVALIGLPPVRPSRSARAIKRALDAVGATVLLLASAPLFAMAAALIKLDSKGPVFFRQARLGEGMREFTILKFRTMGVKTSDEAHRRYLATIARSDSAPGTEGLFKLKRADAVTRVGRWLRSTSLDELPQLLNVLRGDMSLVGPRPCLPYELEYFAPHHFERFLVPAGLTGLWQVTARAHSTFVEALDMDVLYAQSHSFGLDIRLLCRTPLQLFRRQGTA
jgi:exopolysaccharide biosynthesis polyprenyl glycosylphosphotransferase